MYESRFFFSASPEEPENSTVESMRAAPLSTQEPLYEDSVFCLPRPDLYLTSEDGQGPGQGLVQEMDTFLILVLTDEVGQPTRTDGYPTALM